MPYNGNGVFTRLHTWTNEAASGTPMQAAEFDEQEQDFAAAFGNVITRDGQGGPTADIPWNNFGITGLRAPQLAGDAANKAYVDTATASRSMGGFTLTNLANPVNPQDAATKAYVGGTTTQLPAQANNAGKFLTTDGAIASWALPLPAQAGNAGKVLSTNGAAAAWANSLNTSVLKLADGVDATKLLAFDVSGVSSGTTRTLAAPNKNGTLALTSDLILPRPGMGVGRYYTYPFVTSVSAPQVIANVMYGVPVFISETNTFTKIGIRVTAPFGNARLGIYNMDGDALPSTLLVDAGAVSMAASGEKEIAISTMLAAGWYYLAAIFDNASANVSSIGATGAGSFVYGGAAASSDVVTAWAPQIAQAFGALPASFGAATFANMTAAHPLIWVRI
jgi:hypothetical protein